MVITGPSGERTLPAADFFEGFLETAVGADELLTEIRFPKYTGAGWGFQKFNRRAQDWAIVGCSVQAAGNGSNGGGNGSAGGVAGAVALVNMGSTPMLASDATDALRQGSSAAEIGAVAAEGTEPPSDLHAQAAYRQHLARVLVQRAATAAGL